LAILPSTSQPQRGTRQRIASGRRIERWLLCVTGCGETRRCIGIVWCCALAFLAVDVAWLSVSALSFERANWSMLAAAVAVAMLVRAMLVAALINLAARDRRGAVMLRGFTRRCELLCHHGLLLVLLVASFLVFSYLATAAALPLKDETLAALDRALGFDWPKFLAAANAEPRVALALSCCYHSTGPLLVAIVVWLSLTAQEARLAELLAVLALTCVGLAVGMIAVPTAGAFAHFAPPQETFAHFAAAQRMWPFHATFAALRDGSLTVIAFASADGIVSFPSFHAALGVVTLWALRDVRPVLPAVVALNAAMMVAVMPVGGHHLTELLGGALTALFAIGLTRLRRRPAIIAARSTRSPAGRARSLHPAAS
jgi:PAP2 superfamily